MTAKSRAARRAAARQAPPPKTPSATKWLLPAAGLVIAAVAVIAIVLSQGGAGPVASASPSPVSPSTPPVIAGTPLPRFTTTADDPAKGLAAPTVQGHDYQGNPVEITPSGRPTLVIFAAHWCPHCQRELPLIQSWIDAGDAPDDVDLVSVSTGVEPTAPNYPPEAWFERIGWTVPVIVDPTDSVAAAYGLANYPYFVLLDGSGDVVIRLSGEIPIADLQALLAAVPRS